MRIEKREVKNIVTKYIAADETEFDNEQDCRDYEIAAMPTNRELMEKLRLKNVDDVIPITDTDVNFDNTFRWYKVEKQEDIAVLEKMYPRKKFDIKNFPEIVCIESSFSYGNEYDDKDPCIYFLSDCKIETEEFWGKMGYKVIFEKK